MMVVMRVVMAVFMIMMLVFMMVNAICTIKGITMAVRLALDLQGYMADALSLHDLLDGF